MASIDAERIRKDFPILSRQVRGKPLVYLDNAATTQKPQVVIEALSAYYRQSNANIHRGIHQLAEEATEAYERVRAQAARFIGVPSERSIVFTRNATEAINLFAWAWGRSRLRAGDEILLSEMEHHSNLVPWQMLARATGAALRFIPVTGDGRIELAQVEALLSDRTRLVALTMMSNVFGTIPPVEAIVERAHRRKAVVLLDGAQAVPHMPVDAKTIGCDALVFSAHKMLGPTGVGVLYARQELLEAMDPFLGGGEMILDVQLTSATWNEVPWKFEAGTPNIGGVVAFGAALSYLEKLGMPAVHAYEQELTAYALERMSALDGVTLYGPKDTLCRGSVVAFNLDGLHPHDVGTLLDAEGIAIRAGHHCAKPLMRKLGVSATARASFYLYNTRAEVDRLIDAIRTTQAFFRRQSVRA
jgi:cysteine desulfurase/selenocysteine lyase